MGAGLAWLLCGTAGALQPEEALGRTVHQVSIAAADGSALPDNNLQPLLQVEMGEPLDLDQLRTDIAMLHRAGNFASVEAQAMEWTDWDESGAPIPVVKITYVVELSPRLGGVELRGVRGVARGAVLESLKLKQGEAWFPAEHPVEQMNRAAETALAQRGWPNARVDVQVEATDLQDIALVVDVELGRPLRYARVDVGGPELDPEQSCALWRRRLDPQDERCGLHRRDIRRWLRREGLARGRRAEAAVQEAALGRVKVELHDRGYMIPRVSGGAIDQQSDEDRRVALVTVEPGPRVVYRVEGLEGARPRLPAESDLPGVLGIYPGDRVDQGFAGEFEQELLEWFDRRGFPSATSADPAGARVHVKVEPCDAGYRVEMRADPGPRHHIRRFQFTGQETWTARYLQGAIQEAAPGSLGRRRLSRLELEAGLQALRELYRGMGFLSADIQVGDIRPTERRFWSWRHKVVVPITVREGPQTRLSELKVEGPTQQLADRLSSAQAELVGQPLRQGRLDALVRELTDALRSQGYLDADVRLSVELINDGRAAIAHVSVQPGDQILLRTLLIQGAERTRRGVIEREVAVEVGDPITPQGLDLTRSQLYDLDIFRVVSPELMGDDVHIRDLVVVVDEKPNILLEAGGGVSSDQGAQIRGRAAHRNLGGNAQSLSLSGQIGLAWQTDEWLLDTSAPVWKVGSQFVAPWVGSRKNTLIIDGLLLEAAQEPGFRLVRSGGGLGMRIKASPRLELLVDFKAQVRRLDDVDPGVLVPGDPWLEVLNSPWPVDPPLPTPSDWRVQVGPSLLLLSDGRDDRLNPTSGTFGSGSLALADGLSEDTTFVRMDLRMEQYLGVGPLGLHLTGRGGLGLAAGEGRTLPVEERFFLGGTSSLRGFREYSLGPANFVGRPDVDYPGAIEPLVEGTAMVDSPAHWVATGGDALLVGSVELKVPFSILGNQSLDGTSLVLFSDIGRVSFIEEAIETDLDRAATQRWRVGVGPGLRVATPIGPLAVDLGFNLWPEEILDEPAFVPHFSLGVL